MLPSWPDLVNPGLTAVDCEAEEEVGRAAIEEPAVAAGGIGALGGCSCRCCVHMRVLLPLRTAQKVNIVKHILLSREQCD